MPTFVTDFAPPADPSGFEIEADLDASAVRMSWDVSPTADVDFGGYRIYRSTDNGATFDLLALITAKTDVSYDDYSSPLNTSLTYRLTQSNLDFESEPAEASVELVSLAWWVVIPEDLNLTFPITRVRGANLTSPKVQDYFVPIGRPSRIAVGDVVLAEEGTLSFLIMPDSPATVALLKRIQARMDGAIILKAPDGAIHEVQYGDMSRSYTNIVGVQEVSIPFVGVS